MMISTLSKVTMLSYQVSPSQIKEQIDGRIQKLMEIFDRIQTFK